MKYSKVCIQAFGYELAPHVVTSEEIEARIKPFFHRMGFEPGQLVALTGIRERRFWDVDHTLAEPAAKAGLKALEEGGISPKDLGTVVYCGIGMDGFEPSTACGVADQLGVGPETQVYDVRTACLGAVTGMVQVANEIELGHIKAGLVVSCETARQIVDSTINEINANKSVDFYKEAVATMTGGSGAAAVLLTDGTLGDPGVRPHRIKGGVLRNAIRHHGLCRWGFEEKGMPTTSRVIMRTDGQGVMENGLALARKTFAKFRAEFNLGPDQPDKFIGHQVGSLHHQNFYNSLGLDIKKDFCTYPFLGNVGTVSMPITAAIADERGFLEPDDFVALMGIGSGLNCYMLGVEW
ncbi:MAG: 3-oxoacyl-ACP synthase III [Desulfobacterales bacterium]|nr:3-oxoacyl-ACP synthase III [Desulfobacterales bacterium]